MLPIFRRKKQHPPPPPKKKISASPTFFRPVCLSYIRHMGVGCVQPPTELGKLCVKLAFHSL